MKITSITQIENKKAARASSSGSSQHNTQRKVIIMTFSFTQKFDASALLGESISLNLDYFEFRATLAIDDLSGAPDENCEGFWPSLDPESAGFIGEGKTAADLLAAHNKAQALYDGWLSDKWFYCAVLVEAYSLHGNGEALASESLYGLECNASDNSNLSDAANELLGGVIEGLKEARPLTYYGRAFDFMQHEWDKTNPDFDCPDAIIEACKVLVQAGKNPRPLLTSIGLEETDLMLAELDGQIERMAENSILGSFEPSSSGGS